MSSRSASGVNSIVIGALSIVVISVAEHCESLRGTASAYLLTALDRLGFVREAVPGAVSELRSTGLIFPLTDEVALRGLLFYGIYLAIASLVLAVWAEYRREDNLYLGAGFMCGAGGLLMASKIFGGAAVAAGFIAVLLLRHARQPGDREE